jgi:hypothetical protein
MKRFLILMSMVCVATAALAQKTDVAFVVGGSFVSDTQGEIFGPAFFDTLTIQTDHHVFLEGALGVRLLNTHLISLHVDLPVAGIPSQTVKFSSNSLSLPGTVLDHLSTIFVTPGVKIKVLPGAAISPWASVGGGWAHYSLNDAGSTQNKAALQYGGGLDFKTGLPLLGFRAEVRDFVTATPDFGTGSLFVTSTGLHHHNILAGGGIVFRF